jgi:hypothetical protein
LQHTVGVDRANGVHAIYGGLAGDDGIGRLTFGAGIAGMATAQIGGNIYVFTASGTENGVSTWGRHPAAATC